MISPTRLFIFLIGLTILGASHAEAQPVSTVTLPIEVLGAAGHVESVTIQVADPAGIDSLYLRGHALGYTYTPAMEDTLGYDKKANFRINGGAWIPIDNDRFRAFYPESKMFSAPLTGPIGGPYHTLRGMIAIAGTGPLVAGANTIEFRFNGTEGNTSGYRILELDLRSTRHAPSALTNTVFVEDDPAHWAPPSSDPADVAAGEALWHRRNYIASGPQPDATTLVAACGDCHATSGRDLQYFNFSNKSIIVRSEFHGLTEEEAEQIASYIRSIDLELPPGEDVATCGGRPWDPPYQPGPGLGARPVECWAAGAGVDWGNIDDRDMLPHMFPGAASKARLDALTDVPDPENFMITADLGWSNTQRYIRADSAFRLTDIPRPMQMPTIYEWWPDIYPGDYFGDGGFHTSNAYNNLQRLHADLAVPGTRENWIETAANYRNSWRSEGLEAINRNYRFELNGKNPSNGGLIDDAHVPAEFWDLSLGATEIARLSMRQWSLMKFWEVVHEYKLEDLGEEIYEPNQRGIDMRNWDRGWPGGGMIVYSTATHMQGGGNYPDVGPYPTTAQDGYFSSTWYQLSQILHHGFRRVGGSTNIDWNYVYDHLTTVQKNYASSQFYHHLLTAGMMMQQRGGAWFATDGQSDIFGWGANNRPGWRDTRAQGPTKMMHAQFNPLFAVDITAGDRRFAMETMLRAWHQQTLRYPTSAWQSLYDAGSGDSFGGPDLTHTWDESRASWGLIDNGPYGVPLLDMVGKSRAAGVSPALLDSIATYWEAVWPNMDWEEFMLVGSPPEVTLTSPVSGSTHTAPADVVFAANASDADGAITVVEFYVNGTRVGDDGEAPFEYPYAFAPGTYELSARTHDDDGNFAVSGPVTITVTQPILPPLPTGIHAGLRYEYFEGLWDALPDFDQLTLIDWGTTTTFDVDALATRSERFGLRFTGLIEVPETGTYTFYVDSDDGFRLRVGGHLVLDRDGIGVFSESAEVALEAGYQPLELEYFEKDGGQSLALDWTGPGFPRTPVPPSALWHGTPASDSQQTMTLQGGWNLVSLNVTPADPALAAVLSPIGEQIVRVKDVRGDIYAPDDSIDEIGTWRLDEAYMVHVTEPTTLTITGSPIRPESFPVALEAGWNWVPYIRTQPQAVQTALASVMEHIVLVKDHLGQVFSPGYGIDMINDLQPGRGYQVFVSQNATLTYVPNGTDASQAALHNGTTKASTIAPALNDVRGATMVRTP